MIGAVRFPLTMMPVLVLLTPPVMAAPIASPSPPTAQVALMRPLTLTKLADLDFGNLGVTNAGTAIINPVTNTLAVTGGVIRLGGTPHAARFAGSTQSSAVVIIRIPNGAVAMTRWIRQQVASNAPYDQFVRAILTAEGATLSESPAAFFLVQKDPEKLARSVSQLFLGVRIECAQCHHHPFERWDQKDYVALAGFFTGVDRRAGPRGQKIVDQAGTDLPHPRTGELAPAAGLGAAAADFTQFPSRRAAFAQWVTQPENPFFARILVNRLWAHYMGRGLVEPVDDMRATNPASNEPLLDALVQHFIQQKYDIQAFTRTLLDSHAYQLSSQVKADNSADEQNHSHASWKPLPAEVLLDAISQSTGVPEEFNGWPAGS